MLFILLIIKITMKITHYKKVLFTLAGGVLGLALFLALGTVSAGPNMGTDYLSSGGGTLGAQFQLSREKNDRVGQVVHTEVRLLRYRSQ